MSNQKHRKRMLAYFVSFVMFFSFVLVNTLTISGADVNSANTAMFGTPVLGTNDPLWETTDALIVANSNLPADDTRTRATGEARVLWDEDFLYVRVVVTDADVYTGATASNQWEYDGLEFFVGPGNNGANQWRINAGGTISASTGEDRDGWTEITSTGYIAEMKIPRKSVVLADNTLITFDIGILNSTSEGMDRYECVSWYGTPDAGYSSDDSFRDSLRLVSGDASGTRHRINATAGINGAVSPSGITRVAEGQSQTFNFIPANGYLVDTVTVNGETVTVTDDSYTFTDVTLDPNNDPKTIHVTFKPDPNAVSIDFIVWNDNFATGEFTTAVIIDLGAGNSVAASSLNDDMFTVTGRNVRGAAVVFDEVRDVMRVYANSEPKVRGYLGEVTNSPDYQPGLDSGRYIVIEFPWTRGGGIPTLDDSNSTTQVYSIIANKNITLEDGTALDNAVFTQTGTVNPIIDQFSVGEMPLTGEPDLGYTQYIHKDANGQPVQGLPLYIYAHGNMRGGGTIGDVYAPLKSANGAVALLKRIEKEPRFNSHIIALRSTSGHMGSGHAPVAQVKAIIDDLIAQGLVDEDRIYMSGFSLGAGYTNEIANSYLGLFAAIAPMAGGAFPNAEQANGHDTMSLWAFVNNYDHSFIVEGTKTFVSEQGTISEMKDAKVTFFESIESHVWPYDQWPPERVPPYENWYGHEIEHVVLYNKITEANWNIEPTHATIPWNGEYIDVFDWMYSQSKSGIVPRPEPEPEPIADPPQEPEETPATDTAATPADSSFPTGIIIAIALAVIIAVIVVVVLLRKKKKA